MTKEDYLQKLSREQLTDEQIVDGFEIMATAIPLALDGGLR